MTFSFMLEKYFSMLFIFLSLFVLPYITPALYIRLACTQLAS